MGLDYLPYLSSVKNWPLIHKGNLYRLGVNLPIPWILWESWIHGPRNFRLVLSDHEERNGDVSEETLDIPRVQDGYILMDFPPKNAG